MDSSVCDGNDSAAAKWRVACVASVIAGAKLTRLPRIARMIFSTSDKEIHMTTNKPVELGRVSEETKEVGPISEDNPGTHMGPFTA